MRALLAAHILAGGVGLVVGYTALFARKGGTVHRRSGRVFVYAMLAMTLLGAILAPGTGVWVVINVAAALTAAYLVVTSLVTVRRPAGWPAWLDRALLGVALVVALAMLSLGGVAVAGGGQWRGIPAFPFFLFGVITALAAAGDARVLRAGPLAGPPRLARHLWRMSMALYIAAMSFFIGQADEFPAWLRIYPLLAVPVLAVLVTMGYWLWRVRGRRLRGVVVEAPV